MGPFWRPVPSGSVDDGHTWHRARPGHGDDAGASATLALRMHRGNGALDRGSAIAKSRRAALQMLHANPGWPATTDEPAALRHQ